MEQRAGRGGNKKRRACFSVARRATRRLITISKNSGNQIWHARSTPPSSCNFTFLVAIILPTLLPFFIYFNSMVFRKLDGWLIPKFYFSFFFSNFFSSLSIFSSTSDASFEDTEKKKNRRTRRNSIRIGYSFPISRSNRINKCRFRFDLVKIVLHKTEGGRGWESFQRISFVPFLKILLLERP